ncbi:hypothetical protein TNCV_4042971 [Trichonephila clavipes]|nr:hypothetical protein TNCV_4042971 [Trichonephila clavipes]
MSDRGPRNLSWQWARCTHVVGLKIEYHTCDSMIQLGEIPEGKKLMFSEPVRQFGLLYERWRHHRSPSPQFSRQNAHDHDSVEMIDFHLFPHQRSGFSLHGQHFFNDEFVQTSVNTHFR